MSDAQSLRDQSNLGENDWRYILEPLTDHAVGVSLNLPSRIVKRADGVVENESGTPLFRMVCVGKPATRKQVKRLQEEGRLPPLRPVPPAPRRPLRERIRSAFNG